MRRGKLPRRIRYFFYCSWAVSLKRNEIGADTQYTFPPVVLRYLRLICPGNVKGEIREDATVVSLGEFCNVLNLTTL